MEADIERSMHYEAVEEKLVDIDFLFDLSPHVPTSGSSQVRFVV
jgi:hypothetical protein